MLSANLARERAKAKEQRREYMREYMRKRKEAETGSPSYTRGPYKLKQNKTDCL